MAGRTGRAAALTPEQVATSVASELDPSQASIVVVGNASQFIDGLRADYPNVEVIPLAEFDSGSPNLRQSPTSP